MSTIGLDSWAVDLKDVGAVYPFQGWEVVMAIIGVVLWICWHIWQVRAEGAEYKADIASYGSPEAIKKALDEHP